MESIIYLVLIVGVFYFLLIMPEQKKQKKLKQMMESLQIGDVVFTRGGIKGTIVNIEESIVTLATGPDKVKIHITRQGIGSVAVPVGGDITSEEKAPAAKKFSLFK